MKHLIDLDDELLASARRCLGTATIKATVDRALRNAVDEKAEGQLKALRGLGAIFEKIPDFDRAQAW